MKNIKRILSILVVLILAGMYLATFIFAMIDSPDAFECLKISVGLTIIVPVLLWIYLSMFRFIKKRRQANEDASKGKEV